jgi:hypothetical protein
MRRPYDCFLSPESPYRELLPSTKIGASRPPSRALLRSLPSPKTPVGEFAVLRRPCRARPRRERLAIAPEPPHRSRGHGAATLCVALPSSPAGAVVSHPRLDQRPRLDQEDTLDVFNLSRRLLSRRPPFIEVPWTGGPERRGSGLRTVDLFY